MKQIKKLGQATGWVNNERSGVLYAADGLLLPGVIHDAGSVDEGEED
jgi:hypothetical protein